MKKTIIIKILLPVLVCIFLWSCAEKKPAISPTRTVTHITVTCQNGPLQTRLHYTSAVKMRAILNYLRWIDPYGVPHEDPEKIEGISFRIVITFSDGSEKIYLQKADRYMQTDGASWLTINPEKAVTLSQMLGEMKSDGA